LINLFMLFPAFCIDKKNANESLVTE